MSHPQLLKQHVNLNGSTPWNQNSMHSWVENHTWDIVPLPPRWKPIGHKWVYKIKFNIDGLVEHYKARLVAKGFTQRKCFDYHETCSPIAKEVIVRSFLLVVAICNWSLHQLDAHNTFLHGNLDERNLHGFSTGFTLTGEARVCRLRKSLYGLK